MSEEPNVLSSLPRTRPHRRSEKRGTPAGARKPASTRKAAPESRAAKPTAAAPQRPARRKPAPVTGAEIVGTAVQAVGELAELGLALSARALRNATARLPRP